MATQSTPANSIPWYARYSKYIAVGGEVVGYVVEFLLLNTILQIVLSRVFGNVVGWNTVSKVD